MASNITVGDKSFELLLSKEKIDGRIKEIAAEISSAHAGESVVFIIILKGSIFIAADLIRYCTLPSAIEVVRARSYVGTRSSGTVEIMMTDTLDLRGKTVIILEDIVESGRTLQAVHHHLHQLKPAKLLTFSLLRKPKALLNPVHIDYVGFDIETAFVVGYGLDYDEMGRELTDLYQVTSDK